MEKPLAPATNANDQDGSASAPLAPPERLHFPIVGIGASAGGLGDLIAPPEALPGKIIDYLRHARFLTGVEPPLAKKDGSALEKVVILLRDKTGQDFSLSRQTSLSRFSPPISTRTPSTKPAAAGIPPTSLPPGRRAPRSQVK